MNILELYPYKVVVLNNLQLYVYDKYCHIFSPSKHCSALSHPHQRKCEYYVEMALRSTPPHPLFPHWHCAIPISTCWKRCEGEESM